MYHTITVYHTRQKGGVYAAQKQPVRERNRLDSKNIRGSEGKTYTYYLTPKQYRESFSACPSV